MSLFNSTNNDTSIFSRANGVKAELKRERLAAMKPLRNHNSMINNNVEGGYSAAQTKAVNLKSKLIAGLVGIMSRQQREVIALSINITLLDELKG